MAVCVPARAVASVPRNSPASYHTSRTGRNAKTKTAYVVQGTGRQPRPLSPLICVSLSRSPPSMQGILAVRAVGRNSGHGGDAALAGPHAGVGGRVQLLALLLGHPTGEFIFMFRLDYLSSTLFSCASGGLFPLLKQTEPIPRRRWRFRMYIQQIQSIAKGN